jgi:hypothetical protein
VDLQPDNMNKKEQEEAIVLLTDSLGKISKAIKAQQEMINDLKTYFEKQNQMIVDLLKALAGLPETLN